MLKYYHRVRLRLNLVLLVLCKSFGMVYVRMITLWCNVVCVDQVQITFLKKDSMNTMSFLLNIGLLR